MFRYWSSSRLLCLTVLVVCPALGPLAGDDWCRRAEGGPPAAGEFVLNLSAAHAGIRFFGAHAAYSSVDQALARALADRGALSIHRERALQDYAQGLDSVCAVPVSLRRLGAVRVELEGEVAIVRPGFGAVRLPEGTAAVAVDLRHLPHSSQLRTILSAAVAAALSSPIQRPRQLIRRHDGMTDEVTSPTNVYKHWLEMRTQGTVAATGDVALPLALLTGRRMPAEAVELAATLRLANRAWLIGDDLHVSIAESRWVGLGGSRDTMSGDHGHDRSMGSRLGILFRQKELYGPDGRWPDVIPADVHSEEPEDELGQLPVMGYPAPSPAGPATRPAILRLIPFRDYQPAYLDAGSARAALLAAHGAARLFFPYFDVVGTEFDDRLLDTIQELELAILSEDLLERQLVHQFLRRLGEALSDGHNLVYNFGPSDLVGVFPVLFDDIDGQPVVYRSLMSELQAGDALMSIDGESASEWLAWESRTVSAATEGHRFVLASRRFLTTTGSRLVGYRTSLGDEGVVNIDPYPWSATEDLKWAPSLREAGWLGDLGASDLFYINLSGEVLTSTSTLWALLAQANISRGLVLDMRGYPGINHYIAARWLMCRSFMSPRFGVPQVSALDDTSLQTSAYGFSAGRQYCGPIALLVGPATVSAAENFCTMLVDADRVTAVGMQSAGTNGNITGVMLPGRFAFTFTGMQVLHRDGSRFHGIGIVPDIEAEAQADDFATGRDRVLEAAISALN